MHPTYIPSGNGSVMACRPMSSSLNVAFGPCVVVECTVSKVSNWTLV